MPKDYSPEENRANPHEDDTGIWRRPPAPCFSFPDIAPVAELSFEPLSAENVERLWLLFRNDPSPFVASHFKSQEEAKRYAEYLVQWGAYTPTHGGKDWLFHVAGRDAGILHIYDLSRETFNDNHKRAWIGFATTETFRKQKQTSRAVHHFIKTIFAYYTNIDFIHAMTLKDNTASINFLLKLGFEPETGDWLSEKYCHFLLTRAAFSDGRKA